MQFGKLCLTDPLHLILRFLTFVYAQHTFCPSLPYENYSPSNEPYWVKNPHVQNRSNITYKVKMMTATTTSTNTIKQQWNMSIMYQKSLKWGLMGIIKVSVKKLKKIIFTNCSSWMCVKVRMNRFGKIFIWIVFTGSKYPLVPLSHRGSKMFYFEQNTNFSHFDPLFDACHQIKFRETFKTDLEKTSRVLILGQ